MKRILWTLLLTVATFQLPTEARSPAIDPSTTKEKIDEIMSVHASQKKVNPTLIQRAFVNFIEELDPTKTYFVESDIHEWLEPSEQLIVSTEQGYEQQDFSNFFQIHQAMVKAIERRDRIEQSIDLDALPTKVDSTKFKDLKWAKDEGELQTRIMEVKALQLQAAKRLNDELQEKSLKRIDKIRRQHEEELLTTDCEKREKVLLAKVLKSFASSLDSHTVYFTPDEAEQFLINVQQRLFGIGAALRDDINGFRVIKIVEGGPAERSGELKVDDLIIAVNGEPVVGMNITDAVNLIRGEEDTPVVLTVIREKKDDDMTLEQTLDVTILRGEVVLKETRYEVGYEPFGDGVIAYLRLFSFYQDPEFSSATDLANQLSKLKEEHKVLGVVLDLRSNSGGMLSQAVAVAGLFITKGVVVSIKDEEGKVQHLRDIDGRTVWNGPLVVLINRASASASEIVAQTLQDYGRALVIGDDHSFGKGSFQTFTLNAGGQGNVNPEGEYKVTRGRYYTVSGKSPQLVGVQSDIVVPGPYSEIEIGEKFAKYPLETDSIAPNFDDDLSDLPYFQRSKISSLYKYNLQQRSEELLPLIPTLRANSEKRVENSKAYQAMLEELKKKEVPLDEEPKEDRVHPDFQLTEGMNVMRDLIVLKKLKILESSEKESASMAGN